MINILLYFLTGAILCGIVIAIEKHRSNGNDLDCFRLLIIGSLFWPILILFGIGYFFYSIVDKLIEKLSKKKKK